MVVIKYYLNIKFRQWEDILSCPEDNIALKTVKIFLANN